MTGKNFDKDLQQLYQQRKSQVLAPEVTALNMQKTQRRHHTWSGKLAILMMGGAASFGILAIVSHLAKAPQVNKVVDNTNHQVSLNKVVPEKELENAIVVKPVLPAKPAIPPVPDNSQSLPVAAVKPQARTADFTLPINIAQVVQLPDIAKPEAEIIPHYKVMPKYPASAIKAKQSGAVKLSYKINDNGQVYDINIVDEKRNRALTRAAKQALTQWQYAPEQASKNSVEVIFEFKLPKS